MDYEVFFSHLKDLLKMDSLISWLLWFVLVRFTCSRPDLLAIEEFCDQIWYLP